MLGSDKPRGCALLEIKNLKSGETHVIPPEGALMGREGAKADIPIRDPGVSKKHARIYEKGGIWYLQDVGSSNGTFMQGKRLTGPTALTEGSVFGMSRHKFKVTRIGNGQPLADNGIDDDEPLFGDDLAPPEIAPSMEPQRGAPPRPPLPQDDYPSLSPSGPDEVSYGELGATAPPGPASGVPSTAYAASGGDEIEAKGIGYFFIAVPKAIAFYLAAVPLLALNPFGTVRKSIEDQKHAPMGRMEIIAYSLPAQVFGALFASWCAFIGALIGPAGFQFSLLVPIVPVVVAVVVSAITGFILHPVLEWIIRFLKGSSDARSRTNYFLLLMTASVLSRLPEGIGLLLAMTGLPFISIIPPLLILYSTLLMLLVAYKWLVYFNVHNVVQKVVLVLGLLAALGTGYSVVTATIASFKAVLSGGGGGEVDTAGADAAQAKLAELTSQLAAIGTDTSLTPEQKAEKVAALNAEIVTAQQAAAAAQAAAAKAAEEAQAKAAEEAKKAAEEAAAQAKKAGDDAAKADDAKKQADDDKKATEPVKADEPPKKTESTKAVSTASSEKLPTPSTSYSDFRTRRDGMEKLLSDDPTWLRRSSKLEQVYAKYHRVKHEIDERYAAKTAAEPALKAVHDRLAEDELYRRTAADVDRFWEIKKNVR